MHWRSRPHRARHHDRLAGAVVAAGQERVQGVAAPRARQVVRQVRVVGLDGVPHGRASFRLCSGSRSTDPRPRYESAVPAGFLTTSRAWHDQGRDHQRGGGAAAARPQAAAPGQGPDRPRLRAAAGRRGARARRAPVGRAPEPRVQEGVRRVAVLLPDDPADRAGHALLRRGRPQRDRRLLRGRLLSRWAPSAPGSPSWSACRRASTSSRPPGALAGRAVVRGQAGDETDQARPIRNREATSADAS